MKYADFLCDLAESLEVDDPGICRSTCKDELGVALQSLLSYALHVDISVIVYIVELHVIEVSAEVYAGTVSKVSAVVKVKA